MRLIYLGYIFVCGIGLVIRSMNKKQISLLIATLAVVFVTFSLFYNFKSVQIEKYPPTAYYISYGLLASVLLYLCSQTDTKLMKVLKCNNTVSWISQNSFWIYLWHIIPVKILVDYEIIHMDSWILRYVIILLSAFAITALCNLVKQNTCKRRELSGNS